MHFTVDIRSWDDEHALKVLGPDVRADFEVIAAGHGLPHPHEETWPGATQPPSPDLTWWSGCMTAAEDLGYSTLPMVSGAGP